MTSRRDHTIVFILSTLLFTVGILAGVMLSSVRISDIESKITNFDNNIDSIELGFLISDALKNETISCKFLQGKLNETKTLLVELSDKVVDYEAQSKIRDDTYLETKMRYNSIRAKYWLMLEKLKTQCNNNYTTILFFYQTKNPCPACRDQGVILTYISNNNPDIYVVPLDADEELLIIEMIKEAYMINQTPTIVIDASIIRTGLVTEDEILNLTAKS